MLGEASNTITSYGYDPVTGMHEGKVTLCQSIAGEGKDHGSRQISV